MLGRFKHITAIILLGLFLVQNLLSVSLWYSIHKDKKAHREMISTRRNELQTLVFTPEEFKMVYREKYGELCIDEDFYDIEEIQIQQGKIMVKAIKDKPESQLNSLCKKEPAKQHRKQLHGPGFHVNIFLPTGEISFNFFKKFSSGMYNNGGLNFFPHPYYAIAEQPPENGLVVRS